MIPQHPKKHKVENTRQQGLVTSASELSALYRSALLSQHVLKPHRAPNSPHHRVDMVRSVSAREDHCHLTEHHLWLV